MPDEKSGRGPPLDEQLARYSPFVMNSEEEIMQGVCDFQNGGLGEITCTAALK